MDFYSLPRRELQALCKKNKIPANMTNVAMADALKALLKVEGMDSTCDAEQFESPGKAEAVPPNTSPRTTARKNASVAVANADEVGDVTTRRRPARGSSRYAEKEVDGVPLVEILDTPAPTGRKQKRVPTQQQVPLTTPATTAVTARRSSRAMESAMEENKGEVVPTAEILGTPVPTGKKQTRAKTQQLVPATTAVVARRSSVRANRSRAAEAAVEEEKGEAFPKLEAPGVDEPKGPISEMEEFSGLHADQTVGATKECEGDNVTAVAGDVLGADEVNSSKTDSFVYHTDKDVADGAEGGNGKISGDVQAGDVSLAVDELSDGPVPEVSISENNSTDDRKEEGSPEVAPVFVMAGVDVQAGDVPLAVEELCDAPVPDVYVSEKYSTDALKEGCPEVTTVLAMVGVDVEAGDVPVVGVEAGDVPVVGVEAGVVPVVGDEPVATEVCVAPVPEVSAPEKFEKEFPEVTPVAEKFGIASEKAVTIDDELCGVSPVPDISDFQESSADYLREKLPESNCTTVISPVVESSLQKAATFEMGTPVKSPLQAGGVPVEDEEPVATEFSVTENYSADDLQDYCPKIMPVVGKVGVDVKASNVPVGVEQPVETEVCGAPVSEVSAPKDCCTQKECPEVTPVAETFGAASEKAVTIDGLCSVPVPEVSDSVECSADDLREEAPQSNCTPLTSPVVELSLQKENATLEMGTPTKSPPGSGTAAVLVPPSSRMKSGMKKGVAMMDKVSEAKKNASVTALNIIKREGVEGAEKKTEKKKQQQLLTKAEIQSMSLRQLRKQLADDLREKTPQSNCTTVISPVVELSTQKTAPFEMGTPVKSPPDSGTAAALVQPSSRMKSGVKKEVVARMDNVSDYKENAGVIAFSIDNREGMEGGEDKTEKKKQQRALTKAEIQSMSLRQLRKQLAALSISNTPAAAKIGGEGIDKVAVEGKKIKKKRSALAALNENCLMSPQRNCC